MNPYLWTSATLATLACLSVSLLLWLRWPLWAVRQTLGILISLAAIALVLGLLQIS